MLFSTKTYALLLAASFLLTACGGGSSDSGSASSTVDATSTSAAVDCYLLTPGTQYTRTGGNTTLIVQEQFEGQTVRGAAYLRADSTRSRAEYLSSDADFINLLGVNSYDAAGTLTRKTVYSGFRLPTNFAVGQTINVTFSETETVVAPASTTTTTTTRPYTFEALDTLTLGGRTFENVCRLRTTDAMPGRTYVTWIAKGFGVIKWEVQQADGTPVASTQSELVSIEAAP